MGTSPVRDYLEYEKISTPHGSGLMLELPPVEQLVKVFEEVWRKRFARTSSSTSTMNG